MKKNKITLILLFSLAILHSCQEDNDLQSVDEVADLVATPSKIISVEDAGKMYSEYGEKRANFLEKNLTEKASTNPYMATRRVYINYTELKNYLAYIEQEAVDANVDIHSLGLYFSKYPDDGIMPSGKDISGREGTENLFINPLTLFSGSDYPTAYYIDNNIDGTKEAFSVRSILDKDEKSKGDGKSMAMNHLPWNPPPANDPPKDY